MTTSIFQFTNPSVIYVKFIENDGFKKRENEDIEINAKIKTEPGEIVNNECSVNATVIVGEETDKVPFLIEVKISARFKWGEGVQNIDMFLEQNAPSLLISYVRPIIAMITDSSHYSAYHLPFINFADHQNEK